MVAKGVIRRRRVSVFAGLLLCVALVGTGLPIGAVAQTSAQTASVASAATELSRTWERGDLFAVYDRMHPDARNAFPRMAFLQWATSDELGVPLDDPEISDVVFAEDWESPLTGEVYDEAALVSYRQLVELIGESVVVDAEQIFVRENLRWRWLPSLEPSEVDSLNEQLDGVVDAEPYESDFLRAAYVRIDRFWQQIFAAAAMEYDPPDAIVPVIEQPLATGCGPETEIEEVGIYYCVLDESVYFDPGFRELIVDLAGSYGFTMIISHEWGHHVQQLLGIGVSRDPELDGGLYPIELELQADCLAGIYAQDALANGLIDQDDVDAAIAVSMASGDRRGTDWSDADAHGTGDQRAESFMTGLEDGFLGCNVELGPEVQVTIAIAAIE